MLNSLCITSLRLTSSMPSSSGSRKALHEVAQCQLYTSHAAGDSRLLAAQHICNSQGSQRPGLSEVCQHCFRRGAP